jgi:4-diphosphocytidyl-2-C-methyl-D-erythritol kinase
MSAARVELSAPAKVNLSLAVLGTRPDGYHELDSVLLALDLCDRLVLERTEPGSGLQLKLSGPQAAGVPSGVTNLALRAVASVHALARGAGAPGYRLRLTKSIPAQAGLGGGSADAAAAALGAALLLGLDPDDPELGAALAVLGSDCPFFLRARRSGLARCTGRGEHVQPLDAPAPSWCVALVTPAIGCSTQQVYGALGAARAVGRGSAFDLERFLGAGLDEARALLRNDLEPAALAVQPELRGLHALLAEAEPDAFHLAGSGSSFFALCADERAARDVLERVRVLAEARRYALRGRWVLRARGAGVGLVASSSHLWPGGPA